MLVRPFLYKRFLLSQSNAPNVFAQAQSTPHNMHVFAGALCSPEPKPLLTAAPCHQQTPPALITLIVMCYNDRSCTRAGESPDACPPLFAQTFSPPPKQPPELSGKKTNPLAWLFLHSVATLVQPILHSEQPRAPHFVLKLLVERAS